jgi:hypothetical protein
MASPRCWSVCPKPRQVASESVHGAQLALQPLSRRCETCDVEASTPCSCRKEAVARDTEEDSSGPNSSFAHSVINMVGMLIGIVITAHS